MTPSRAVTAITSGFENRRVSDWMFEHYLGIAPPSFVDGSPPTPRRTSSRRQVEVPATV
jgi:hypothetical protein